MAKRMVGESKEAVAETLELASKPEPVITFSESQVQKVADFINFMYLNAEFKGGMKDFKKVNTMFADMHEHVKLIESHIFELKKIRAAKKATE